MSSYKKKIRVGVVLIPAIILCIALTQNAFVYEHQGNQTHSSISILFMGGFAVLGGGILEWLIWLANPIAFIACIRFLRETNSRVYVSPSSRGYSILAAALAWAFSLWDEILASESGNSGLILSLEYGYWLWVSSFTALSIGINAYYFYFGQNSSPDTKDLLKKTDKT